MMMPAITIYTDGACRGNPGDGGWGALLISGANEKSICGGEKDTTNNRMELLAVIKALEIINQTSEIKIYTDSTYVQKGITEWIHTWKRNHWKNSCDLRNSGLATQLPHASSRPGLFTSARREPVSRPYAFAIQGPSLAIFR